jgi:hypothetical protein
MGVICDRRKFKPAFFDDRPESRSCTDANLMATGSEMCTDRQKWFYISSGSKRDDSDLHSTSLQSAFSTMARKMARKWLQGALDCDGHRSTTSPRDPAALFLRRL